MDQIRNLQVEELDESLSLSEFAFQYEINPAEREEQLKKAKPEQLWGYFTNGKLSAQLTILPLHTYIRGHAFAMGGIAGVASWPEYRRQGMVGRLLEHALSVMTSKGQTVSFLAPFSFAFYRKYGWEAYVEYKRYTVELVHLPQLGAVEGTIERIGQDWELLNRIYDPYAVTFNGMLRRDEEWWKHRIFGRNKGQVAVYYNAEREPRGYLLYQVKNREMTIREMVFHDETARRAMWKFISNHDSMIDKVTLNAPENDRLSFLLPNPRFKQETVPYFMARIVDVPGFIGQYPFAATGKSQRLLLAVEDKHAAWNNGVFSVAIDQDGRAEVKKAESESGAEYRSSLLSCDIQTLTAMLLGYQRPSFLHAIGRLQGDAAEVTRLEQTIPVATTYLTDFF